MKFTEWLNYENGKYRKYDLQYYVFIEIDKISSNYYCIYFTNALIDIQNLFKIMYPNYNLKFKDINQAKRAVDKTIEKYSKLIAFL